MNELLIALMAQLSAFQESLDVEIKAAYERGFAEGVASVVVGDKVFSQEEVDGFLAPLNAKIEELTLMVSTMQADMDAKITEAMASFKAELLAKYEESQVAESLVETGFKEFLK